MGINRLNYAVEGGIFMKEVVIAGGVRTPIGAYCGMLREVPVEKLGRWS